MSISGWKNSSLVSLLDVIKSGGTPSTSRTDFYGGEISFVAIEDMSSSDKYLSQTAKTITTEGLKNSSAWLVAEGSILYSIYATLGLVRINKVPVATNQAILAMIVNDKLIDREYLYYWLGYIRDSVINLSSQTTQSNLSSTTVKPFIVQHPQSKKEQEKIAAVLSTIDTAIAQTEAIIAKQQRVKTGLMQDLLTKGIDAAGNVRSEATHEFKDSAIGRIPVEWKVKKLDDCVELKAPICYGILMPGTDFDNGIPVIKVKDIYDGIIHQENLLLTDPKIDNQYRRSRLKENDILMTIRGTTGRLAIVPKELEGANITQDSARIRLKSDYLNEYIYFLMQSKHVQDQITLNTLGQAVKGINISEVKKIFFAVPSKDEQSKIADKLNTLEALSHSDVAKLNKLRALKTGLMQDLLTGKVRVTALLPTQKPLAHDQPDCPSGEPHD